VDDLSGLQADSISLQDEGYSVASGGPTDALDLGAGGLSASTPAVTANPTVLSMPIVLSAPQTWAIASEYALNVTGGVTGSSSDSLGISVDAFTKLNLTGSDDVGPVSISGTSPSTGGAVELRGGDLNGVNQEPVSVQDAGLVVDNNESIGPLTATHGFVENGEWDGTSGSGVETSVNGTVSLDSQSTLDMFIDEPGTTPGADYSQLSATGNINLGGAALELTLGNDSQLECPPLNVGDVDTIIKATGGVLSGTFAGVPNGSVVNFGTVCGGEEPSTTATINYTQTSVTATISSPPVNTQLPTISGTPQQSQTLTAAPGDWLYGPTSYTYQWEDCPPESGCEAIKGATAQAYTVTPADVGDRIDVRVTASNTSGPGLVATSQETATVRPLLPVDTTPPAISGTAAPGQTLTEAHGTWANNPTSYEYQWGVCSPSGGGCFPIPGATKQTYVVTAADVGYTLEVEETAANAAGRGIPAYSDPTPIVFSFSTGTTPPMTPSSPTSSSPTAATIAAALGEIPAPSGKSGSIKRLLAHGGFSFSFVAPSAGQLVVDWWTRVNGEPVLIASANAFFTKAGNARVKLKLSRKGRTLLKAHKRVHVTTTASFTPSGGSPITTTKRLTLKR
jgi:hypothetical protein